MGKEGKDRGRDEGKVREGCWKKKGRGKEKGHRRIKVNVR